jgi:hypothetical protein
MKEALKLALEALMDNEHYISENERIPYVVLYNKIIEKCKAALAQPAQEPDAQITVEHYSSGFENITVDFCNLEKGVHLLYATPPQENT